MVVKRKEKRKCYYLHTLKDSVFYKENLLKYHMFFFSLYLPFFVLDGNFDLWNIFITSPLSVLKIFCHLKLNLCVLIFAGEDLRKIFFVGSILVLNNADCLKKIYSLFNVILSIYSNSIVWIPHTLDKHILSPISTPFFLL